MSESADRQNATEEVLAELDNPTASEKNALIEELETVPSAMSRTHFFRFNLNAAGIKRLAREGASQLTDINGDRYIRGLLLFDGRRKMTLFWPGGLGVHLTVRLALQKSLPDITPIDTYRWDPTIKGPDGQLSIFEPTALRQINDILVADARQYESSERHAAE